MCTVRQTRAWSVLIVLLMVSLLTTACAGRVTQEQIEEVAGGAAQAAAAYMPTIKLPRLILVYGDDGVPRLFGTRISTIGRVTGVDLSFMNLQPATLERFTQGNIQYLEIETAEAGLFAYVNGKGLPYLAWDPTSLDRAGDLIAAFEAVPYAGVVDKAMPLLPRLNVDFVLQFPQGEGAKPIPLRDREDRLLAVPADVEPSTVINMVVSYTAEGVPNVAGISTRDLQALTGTDLSFLDLSPATLQKLQAAQIQELALAERSDGLYLLVNGDNVLHLAYTQEHLMNAVEAYRLYAGESALTPALPEMVALFYPAEVNLVAELPSGP